ncbi:MAG: hypothetical protein JJU36_13270 [Phycisphaeraceae bacterium]|nr:hypothetical protein [Phycisphaeraceae bacterium]
MTETYAWPLGQTLTLLIMAGLVAYTIWFYFSSHQRSTFAGDRLWWISLGCRAMALLMLFFVLRGPMQAPDGYRIEHYVDEFDQRPLVVVLADTSMSMLEEDMPSVSLDARSLELRAEAGNGDAQPISRWSFLQRSWLQPNLIRELERNNDVQFQRFDEGLTGTTGDGLRDHEPAGRETRLYQSLEELIRRYEQSFRFGRAGGTILLLSDGHETLGRPHERQIIPRLNAEGWRILAVPVGQVDAAPDLSVSASLDVPILLDGQATRVRARLIRSGSEAPVTSVILREDGRIIERRQVRFDATGRAEVDFVVTPELPAGQSQGLVEYRVETPPLRGETNLDNNTDQVLLEVQRRQMRVLLLEGQASWDTRFLIQSLRQDQLVDLLTAHQLGDRRVVTRHGAGVDRLTELDSELAESAPQTDTGLDRLAESLERARPLSAAALSSVDLVILGRRVEKFFPGEAVEELINYANGGGAILLSAGRPFDTRSPDGATAMRLFDAISPVEWGDRVWRNLELRWTETGRAGLAAALAEFGPGDTILRRLPEMSAATHVQRTRAMTVVLASARPGGMMPDASEELDDPDAPMAAMAYQFLPNQGRVFAVLGEGLWRWAMLPDGREALDGVYDLFWRRLMQWLVMGGDFLPGEEIALRLSENTLPQGGNLDIQVAVRPGDDRRPDLHLTWHPPEPEGEPETIPLSRTDLEAWRWTATISPETEGIHRLELIDRSLDEDDPFHRTEARFGVRRTNLERAMSQARPDLLRRLAEGTQGRLLDPFRPAELIDELGERHQADDETPAPDQQQPPHDLEPAFNKPHLLFWLCVFLCTEWISRRLAGAS